MCVVNKALGNSQGVTALSRFVAGANSVTFLEVLLSRGFVRFERVHNCLYSWMFWVVRELTELLLG